MIEGSTLISFFSLCNIFLYEKKFEIYLLEYYAS